MTKRDNYRIHNDEMIIYCVAKWGVVDIYCKKKKTTKGNKIKIITVLVQIKECY